MRANKLPSIARLRELFDYDPHTGVLRWKKRPIGDFQSTSAWVTFNRQFAGKPAGHKKRAHRRKGWRPEGYYVTISGRQYRAHRIIWNLAKGPIPDGMEVDHKNTNPLDNRLNNLRLATRAQNTRNSTLYASNTSGFRGVYRRGKRFGAYIMVNRKQISLGSFATAEEAHAAYCEAAVKHHGEFARTK